MRKGKQPRGKLSSAVTSKGTEEDAIHPHAQRFLSIFDVINDLFNCARHVPNAEHHGLLLAGRFAARSEVTGVAAEAA
ncbi:MAG: hypothetical protein KDH17_21820 [Rhodocyclaceae bacterium]|nr:hypothetical protein [Rhodocyclaceae bacterium]